MRTRTTGELPLHKAVASGGPLELVELLVRKWEPALNENDWLGRLPLHCAAGLNGPAEVIQYLVVQSHRALQDRDNDGRLPLHRRYSSSPWKGSGSIDTPGSGLCLNGTTVSIFHCTLPSPKTVGKM
jgi:Ankyrin repeats (3 copies)